VRPITIYTILTAAIMPNSTSLTDRDPLANNGSVSCMPADLRLRNTRTIVQR
jgi:hypothetical protein